VAAGLAFAMIMGDYVMGHGKEKDETWGQWWSRKALAAPFTMVPFVGDAATYASDKLVTGKARYASIRNAPFLATGQNMLNLIGKAADGRRKGDQRVWDMLEAAMTLERLPARQWRNTGEYLWEIASGDEVPRGPVDFARGVVYGKRKGKFDTARNPLEDLSRRVLKEGRQY
jgi:hypothetical protein